TFDPRTPRAPVISSVGQTRVRPGVLTPEAIAHSRTLFPSRRPTTLEQPPRLDSTGVSGQPTVAPRLPLADTATVSFPGIPQTIYTPPSPNVAAGPDDVIEIVNATVARFTKSGTMTDSVTLQQWFAANLSTLCPISMTSCVPGDVQIRYDQIHGRFIMSLQFRDDFANDATGKPTGNSWFAISVSNGATY